MARTTAPIIDQYSGLDHKRKWLGRTVQTAPTWVGEHHRRLEAYKLLAAYVNNAARAYLDTDDEGVRDRRREFGDANVIVETIVDAIIGEDARIAVDGAGQTTRPDESGEAVPVDPTADALQEWFDEWDADERPLLAYIEGETDAVQAGDAVYVIGWDTTAGRPTVTPYDPGFYFPVLDDTAGRQYPFKVHIAWEFEEEHEGGKREFIRRITWRLVDLGAARPLPWNADPSPITCLWSDGVWDKRTIEAGRTWQDLDESRATWMVNADGDEIRDLDLDIDFIPVVHVPNTSNRKEHFGRSSLALLLQILDELQSADTDLALTARTTGFPPLGVEGGLPVDGDGNTIQGYKPGTVFPGKVTLVDTSTSLDALLKYVTHLLKRLDTNARLSGAVVGREPEQIASGILFALAQQPLKSMVRRMRLVRDEKYPLVHKFVARFAMQNGDLPPNAELPPIRLAFGSFLPNDVDAEIERIVKLFAAKLLSRLTAIRMLMDLGLSIEDAEEELLAVQHEDYEGAAELRDAVGDEAAADYLGREVEEPEPLPIPPGLPGGPGGPPAPPPGPDPLGDV